MLRTLAFTLSEMGMILSRGVPLSDLDYSRVVLSVAEVGCRGQCTRSFVAVPMEGLSNLWPGGSEGAGEKLPRGFWTHSESRTHRIC